MKTEKKWLLEVPYIKDPDTTSLNYQKKKELNLLYDTKSDSMTEDEIRKVWGENFFRVFSEVEKQAHSKF